MKSDEIDKGGYSPADCAGILKQPIAGNPDNDHVSKSYAERANLTMRMHKRRFIQMTNALYEKFENHAHMVAIYAVWYNWVRIHKTLHVTPAMAAGLFDVLMSWEDIVTMMDANSQPKKRGPYKKTVEQISDRDTVKTCLKGIISKIYFIFGDTRRRERVL